MVALAVVVAVSSVLALYAYGFFESLAQHDEHEVFEPYELVIEDNWFEAEDGQFAKRRKATIRHLTVLRTYNVGSSIGAVVYDHSRDTRGASIIPSECVMPLMVTDVVSGESKDLTHKLAAEGSPNVVNIAKLSKWWSKPANQTPSEWRIPGDLSRSETLAKLAEKDATDQLVNEASTDGDATAEFATRNPEMTA